MKEIRCFNNKDILESIKILEYLRVSLTNIGRLDLKNNNDFEKFLLVENLFISQSDIYKKLTFIWRLLIDNYTEEEEEALDEELELVIPWKVPYHLELDELREKVIKNLNK
jgi:hypothetical protein